MKSAYLILQPLALDIREKTNMSFRSYPAVFSCIEAEYRQRSPTQTIKKQGARDFARHQDLAFMAGQRL